MIIQFKSFDLHGYKQVCSYYWISTHVNFIKRPLAEKHVDAIRGN